MSKAKVKPERVSGFRIAVMIISIIILTFIMAFSMLLGISVLKQHGAIKLSDDATTVRKRLPAEGTLPTDSNVSALDNIGYMAYVLDHQPMYHAYAYNSTKSTGYEQVTQSWKDYKNAERSGFGKSVMVASDLSYSALVKSSSQSCFIGGKEALIRSGKKPGKRSQPNDIEWSNGKPSRYDKNGYKYAYGEFSTEISVYVICKETLESADPVVVNEDGTYSQTYYLNEYAGVWYQYGMKTRGGLKNFPTFRRIEITFTFDSQWQILKSYCEEKATISPRALGGMNMESNSKTTTTFSYTDEGFDDEHFAYYENYFKQYEGTDGPGSGTEDSEVSVTDVLAGGFSKVLDGGQQFNIDLTVGKTHYDAKVFLKLTTLSIDGLEARIALEKKGSGRQDLFIEYKTVVSGEGENKKADKIINVYYSPDFALTANIDEMSQRVKEIIALINKKTDPVALYAEDADAAENAESSDLDLGSLLNDLKLELNEEEGKAAITLKSDNLLGLGIGVDIYFNFDWEKEYDEADDAYYNNFTVTGLGLSYIKYNGTTVDIKGDVTPDDGAIIERNVSASANLADYAKSVYKLLDKNTINVNIELKDDKLVDGLSLNADAYVSIGSEIAAKVDVTVAYKDVSLTLDAVYVYGKTGYGKIYLHVSEFNGNAVDAKVCCDIADAVTSIKNIIEFVKNGGNTPVTLADEDTNTLVNIINKVLNLNFAKVIGKVSGNNEAISLGINVDELLAGLDVSVGGMSFGELGLTFTSEGVLSGSLETLGLTITVEGSDREFKFTDDGYIDINEFISGIESLIDSKIYEIDLSFNGGELTDKIDLSGLVVTAKAYVALENGINNITVRVPVQISYCGLEVELNAYYSADINGKNFSTVYLELTRIDQTDLSVKVYCDVQDAISTVKAIIDAFKQPVAAYAETDTETSGASNIISKVVGIVLNLDYSEIIHCTQTNLSVTLDVDDILSQLEISVGGIAFGDLKLDLTLTDNGAELYGKLNTLGVEMSIMGNDDYNMPAAPVNGEYLDLNAALKLVKDIIDEGKNIAAAKDVAFAINGTAVMGGVQTQVVGSGEVIWNDTLKVAVSLSLTVDGETLNVNIVYDKDSDPLVILTVNEIGTTISRNEIDKLVNSFKGLIGAFTKNEAAGADTQAVSTYAVNVGGYSLEDILTNGNVKRVLNALLGIINDFAVEIETVDGADGVYNLLVKHVGGATVTLGADGCLSLNFKDGGNNLAVSAEVGSGLTFDYILADLTTDGNYEYDEISVFVKKLYDAFFNNIENTLIKLLGDTYQVNINLKGVNSGISVLEGVSVNAEMYFGATANGATKLLHVDLNMNINGTAVVAAVSYQGRNVFIALDKIGGTTLTGIKFKVDVDSIFSAVEELVRLITDTNLVETLQMITGNGTPDVDEVQNIAEFASVTDEDGTGSTSALTNLIGALLTIDLDNAFGFDKNTNTATINVDHISEAVLGVKIGTVTATFNDKSLSATVKTEENEAWFNLNARPLTESRTEVINPDDYMDIGFVSTLVSDLVNTLKDKEGNLSKIYTLANNRVADKNKDAAISIKISVSVLNVDLNFDYPTLTVGIDEDDKFYLTLAAFVRQSTATAEGYISLTYCDGLITLGRNINTNPEYKVVTLNYLIDHLLVKDGILNWWLGTSNSLINTINSFAKIDINSGLDKRGTYQLFESLENGVKTGGFDLGDYLNTMFFNFDGEASGTVSEDAVKKLELESNYYAFDLNAKKFTNRTLTALYAAVLRDGENGLNGLKVYGEVGTSVTFKLDFNSFIKGADVVGSTEMLYGNKAYAEVGTLDEETFNSGAKYYVSDGEGGFAQATGYDASATYYEYYEANKLGDYPMPNYFNLVGEFDRTKAEGTHGEFESLIFGSYTSDGNYDTSIVRKTVYLDVHNEDGTITEIAMPYGSTVKLISDFPVFTDDAHSSRYVYYYVNAEGVREKLPKIIAVGDKEADKDYKVVGVVKDENGEYRATIYRELEDENLAEVELHFINSLDGTEIISSKQFAFANEEEIVEYELLDYSFIGWYTNENFDGDKVTTVNGNMTLYGKYIVTRYEAENGVVYSFDPKLEKGNGGYYASGTTRAIFDYYKGGKHANDWLVIESEINGYPVKYIGQEAFANVYDDTEHSLIKVLVPESVVAVYDRAFLDNKGLRQIVFCAPEIFFGGRTNSDTKTTVFYGCYTSSDVSGNQNKNFTVYYNNTQNNPYDYIETTNNEIDPAWNRIYFKAATLGFLGSDTIYTMLTQQGGWVFADYVFNTDGIDLNEYPFLAELNSVSSGIGSTVFTADEIKAKILKEINDATVENGSFINGFEVSVSCGTAYGKYTVVNIGITAAEKRAYRVTYTGNVRIEGEGLTQYGGSYYATEGSEYTIVPNDSYEITEISGIKADEVENGAYTFTMPANEVEITVTCEKMSFTTVTYKSDIAFRWNETETYSSEREIDAQEEDAMAGAPVAEDTNYVFIGWAYLTDVYVFEGATVTTNVYYAIWAYQRADITLTSNNLTVTSSVRVYGWYADENFSGEPVLACNNNSATFTSSTATKLYAKLSYDLNVTDTTDNDASFYYFTPDNSTKEAFPTGDDCSNSYKSGSGRSFTATIPVPEKQAVNIEYNGGMDNNNCLKITLGEMVYYIRVKGGDNKSSQFNQINGNSSLSKYEIGEMNGTTTVTVHNNAAGSCVTTGSLITLADGSKKRIEELTGSEILLAWDFVTGSYVETQIAYIFYHGDSRYDVVNLVFADSTVVKIIGEHAFYDYQLNDFAFLSKDNYADYIGHKFNKSTGDGYEFVELVDAYVTSEYTGSYSIQTVIYDNFFVEDMLSITPPLYKGLFFFFEYGDNMKYDEAKMQADIEEYGLYEYEDLREYIPQLTYEQFIAFNGAYLKVAVGKNLLTVEQIVEAARLYLPQA